MSVPNTFASATSSIPLANLDANFIYYDTAYSIVGTAVTFNGSLTLSAGTANGVPYLNASKVLTSGSALQFDGANLGLGVTPSAWSVGKALQVGATSAILNDGSGATYLGNNFYFSSGFKYLTTNVASYYLQGNGHSWYNAPSGTAGNPITFTQAMTLDASGRLLVGTTVGRTGTATFVSGTNNTNADYQGSAASFVGPGYVGTSNNPATVSIEDNRDMAIDVGGSIGFGGRYLSSNTTYAQWASISGKKSTGTSGEYGGYLAFYTRTHGTSTIDLRMRLDASGNLGIGTTANASAILDAQSTTKGVRMPNMTTTQKNAIASPAAGLMVFDTTLAKLCVYTGAAWQTITSI